MRTTWELRSSIDTMAVSTSHWLENSSCVERAALSGKSICSDGSSGSAVKRTSLEMALRGHI
ncbi:hypothetical protein [Rhizobium calliandrae]|uniref:hypothetical protein n=1 Tax=Rhizobium calliandrae TaxID=1312182 RepID=UPI0032E3E1D6